MVSVIKSPLRRVVCLSYNIDVERSRLMAWFTFDLFSDFLPSEWLDFSSSLNIGLGWQHCSAICCLISFFYSAFFFVVLHAWSLRLFSRASCALMNYLQLRHYDTFAVIFVTNNPNIKGSLHNELCISCMLSIVSQSTLNPYTTIQHAHLERLQWTTERQNTDQRIWIRPTIIVTNAIENIRRTVQTAAHIG